MLVFQICTFQWLNCTNLKYELNCFLYWWRSSICTEKRAVKINRTVPRNWSKSGPFENKGQTEGKYISEITWIDSRLELLQASWAADVLPQCIAVKLNFFFLAHFLFNLRLWLATLLRSTIFFFSDNYSFQNSALFNLSDDYYFQNSTLFKLSDDYYFQKIAIFNLSDDYSFQKSTIFNLSDDYSFQNSTISDFLNKYYFQKSTTQKINPFSFSKNYTFQDITLYDFSNDWEEQDSNSAVF